MTADVTRRRCGDRVAPVRGHWNTHLKHMFECGTLIIMKKGDIYLFIIIVVACVTFISVRYFMSASGDVAIVYVDSKVYGTYPLDEDITVDIVGSLGKNTLVIQDGKADIVSATCPDGLCVDQHRISREGEEIICLPNRVVVHISSGTESQYDSIAY